MQYFLRGLVASSLALTGWFLLIFATLAVAFLLRPEDVNAAALQGSRKPTVVDSITMNVIGGPYADWIENGPAEFSPNGEHFSIVTHRGNLVHNTNEYSLWLYRSGVPFGSFSREKVITLESRNNQPGIWSVRWIDNRNVMFLGEDKQGIVQLYLYILNTKTLWPLTANKTDIFAFDASGNLGTVAYLGYPSDTSVFNEHARDYGLVVSNQMLANLLVRHGSETDDSGVVYPFEFFVTQRGKPARRIFLKHEFPLPYYGIFVSPDGHYAIVQTAVLWDSPEIRPSWKQYQDLLVTKGLYIFRYALINTITGVVRPLLNSPCLGLKRDIAWAADSKSVVVASTYLPLDGVDDEAERRLRASTEMVVQVDIKSGSLRKIAEGKFDLVRWDTRRNVLFVKRIDKSLKPDEGVAAYHEEGGIWKEVDSISSVERPFKVIEEEDMNTAPKLVALETKSNRKHLLMDLNPEFGELKFAHVEEIAWKSSNGLEVKGGLYLPADSNPGERYPLVIQTHGWDRNRFWVDGPSNAGYAAQALAARGIVVVQVEDPSSRDSAWGYGTVEEGPQLAGAYGALIDYLDQRKLIDRERVGILGWSRTGLAVRYLLTFSKYPIRAAVLADALEAGYMQYLAWLNFSVGAAKLYEDLNGGMPFGVGLESWLKHSTSFNLDRVHTPVRILSFRQYSLLDSWEWYVGLLRLGKPVELIAFADANHDPVKPRERITVQQGDVDWFCFWLKGEADPDPRKREQYERWRKWRDSQGSGQRAADTAVFK